MTARGLAQPWISALRATVAGHESAVVLREAALAGNLKAWTTALTRVVVTACGELGWQAAAKGHQSSFLPIPRQEYLALDVVAFEPAGAGRWRFPTAVIELENQRSDDYVAYALWKVLCVRAALRVVFCYRRDPEQSSELVRHLSDDLIRPLAIPDRTALGGETVLVVGSRSDAETFPYGFFSPWLLDENTGKFGRLD